MSDAIHVESLGKRYLLGERPRYRTLRDSLAGLFRKRPCEGPELWALRDISFRIAPGEIVGVIGRNGAGKSTLLKLLSRITTPSVGRAVVRGRIGSLLEVGTGFHPELTGRENIHLNGSIIGMRRDEIRRRFDAIVAFAEVERFLDTPVKHYSSGMQMRLAFAVAAHLDAEILLMDEVLTVGDASFQRRCLGRMAEIARDGRTVLFVSHQLGTVRNLCSRVLWFDAGRMRADGEPAATLADYLEAGNVSGGLAAAIGASVCDPRFAWESIRIEQDGAAGFAVFNGSRISMHMRFTVRERTVGMRVYVDVCDDDQSILLRSFHDERDDQPASLEPGTYEAVAEFPADLFADRPYWLIFQATIHGQREVARPVQLRLEVHRSTLINRAYPLEPVRARLLPPARWTVRRDA